MADDVFSDFFKKKAVQSHHLQHSLLEILVPDLRAWNKRR